MRNWAIKRNQQQWGKESKIKNEEVYIFRISGRKKLKHELLFFLFTKVYFYERSNSSAIQFKYRTWLVILNISNFIKSSVFNGKIKKSYWIGEKKKW